MSWIWEACPPGWEGAGILASIAGAILALGSFVAACVAAARAGKARRSAERAARVAELQELIAEDMGDLQQLLLTADNYPEIAAKCTRIRGRIVRLRQAAHRGLTAEEQEELDRGRTQIENLNRAANVWKGKEENRAGGMRIAFGHAYEALNTVVAIHGRNAKE